MIQSDIHAAFRRLNKQPWFAFGAIASLAVGMSLATAVFSVVDSVMLRPLPYGDVGRVGFVFQTVQPMGLDVASSGADLALGLRAQATAFEQIAVASPATAAMVVEGVIGTGLGAARVSPNWFSVLRVRPELGRVFDDKDVIADGSVVISHALWMSKFAGDARIIGREVRIFAEQIGAAARYSHRVIGVLPPDAEYPDRSNVWFVLSDADLRQAGEAGTEAWRYNARRMYVIGRLANGATFNEATVQTTAIFKRLYRDNPALAARSVRVAPLRDHIMSWIREPLQLWTAAAIIVALLCAVNFASMSLARGMRRRGEIAVRAALGAARGDIVRELVTEAMVVAAIAGAIATGLAWVYITYAGRMMAGRVLPVAATIGWATVGFGILATVLVGFAFAVAPAFELAKVELTSMLQGHASVTTARRKDLFGQRALVALQLSLALTAVATVTALIQADRRFYSLNTSFDYDQIVFGDVFRRDKIDPATSAAILDETSRRPGVARVAMRWRTYGALVWDEGGRLVESRNFVLHATPNLFDVLGLKLEAGRLPTPAESREGGTYIVSHDLAVQIAGSPEAVVGRRIRVKRSGGVRDWATITGVAPRVGGPQNFGLAANLYDLEPTDRGTPGTYAGLIARVTGPPPVRARELTSALRAMTRRGRGSALATTAKDLLEQVVGPNRGRNQFLATVAGFALLLAVVGMFGLTSYTAELRLREFGIRIALGANGPRVARAMFADIWWMAPVGVAVGVFAAGQLTSYFDALYRNPLATRPLVTLTVGPTIAATATLLVIALAGTAMPLRRVLKLDVMRTVQGG